MTLFRKIYKQANKDIKTDEDMINRVILNVHKSAEKRQSPVPYKRYAKYAVSAAAAVIVVSATVISMPYWQQTRDDGVIIEEQVSTPLPSDSAESNVSNTVVTPYPIESPQTIQNPVNPPLDDYYDSHIKTEKKNSDYTSSHKEKTVVSNQIKNEDKPLEIEDKIEISNFKSEQNSEFNENTIAEDTGVKETATEMPMMFSASVMSEKKINVKTEMLPESQNDEGSAEDIESDKMAMGSAMIMATVPTPETEIDKIEINAPSGFTATETYNGGATFESDNGGRIDVNYYYSGNDDTEPVYDEYENNVSAYFTDDKIDYNIYGTDTDREPVEEVVDSIK